MGSADNRPDMHDVSPLLKLETRPQRHGRQMRDPRRRYRGGSAYPIVHGLSQREKKKKRPRCRDFAELSPINHCAARALAPATPPSYPVARHSPPFPAIGPAGDAISATGVSLTPFFPVAPEISRDCPIRDGVVHATPRLDTFRLDIRRLSRTRLAQLLARERRAAVCRLRDVLAAVLLSLIHI